MKREKIKVFSDMFHCSDPHSEMCETLKTKKATKHTSYNLKRHLSIIKFD